MVKRETLNLLFLVRVQVPQPIFWERWHSGGPSDCKSDAETHGGFEPYLSHQIIGEWWNGYHYGLQNRRSQFESEFACQLKILEDATRCGNLSLKQVLVGSNPTPPANIEPG